MTAREKAEIGQWLRDARDNRAEAISRQKRYQGVDVDKFREACRDAWYWHGIVSAYEDCLILGE